MRELKLRLTMDTHNQNADSPLVSVVIPAYNAQVYIERTISSVLAQTYQNLEVLVVDDGSRDRTAEIVKSIAQKDRRVTLLQQSNGGVAAARNLGIEKSSGKFIAPIDADDIWYPHNIEKQVQCMLEGGDSVGLIYSWSIDIDEYDIPTGGYRAPRIEGEVYTTLICHDFIANASSCLIRRACFQQVGGYNSNLKEQNGQGGEDWDMYLRIAENYQFRAVLEFLVGYRKLSNSMSCDYASMAKSRDLIWQSIRKKYPKIPGIIYRLSTSSFYMNLAYQSNRCGRPKTTLYWIYQALKIDWITPCVRLGLYRLSINSIARLMAEPIKSIWSDGGTEVKSKQKLSLKNHQQEVITISDLKQKQTDTNVKVLAEKILHRLAPKIFGTPKTWTGQVS